MKKLFCGLALIAMITVPSTAAAQVHIGPLAAFAEDVDLGIGGIVSFPLESLHEAIEGAASFTLYFPGDDFVGGVGGVDVGYWEIDALLRYLIEIDNPDILPFVTAGIAIGNFSVDIEGFDIPIGGFGGTEFGFKVGGGAKFNAESALSPFAEIHLGLGDIPSFEIRGGISFSVGG